MRKSSSGSDKEATAATAKVKREFAETLRLFPNVTGVGVGYRIRNNETTDEVCIRVYVSRKLPLDRLRAEDVIPRSVGGVAVDVIEAEFVPFAALTLQERAGEQLGVQAGISIGGLRVTAGTLGAVVSDAAGRDVVLSNWHVLCGSLNARPGERILQPGLYDYGTVGDTFARLKAFALTARLDAACAVMDGHRFQSAEHAGLGRRPLGMVGPTLGTHVVKSGRTTGVTNGRIADIDADVFVTDYPGGYGDFNGQIIVEPFDRSVPFSRPGDSGSVVLAVNGAAVGLLFAGSVEAGRTILNPISDVAIALGLDFGVHPLPCERDYVDLTID